MCHPIIEKLKIKVFGETNKRGHLIWREPLYRYRERINACHVTYACFTLAVNDEREERGIRIVHFFALGPDPFYVNRIYWGCVPYPCGIWLW